MNHQQASKYLRHILLEIQKGNPQYTFFSNYRYLDKVQGELYFRPISVISLNQSDFNLLLGVIENSKSLKTLKLHLDVQDIQNISVELLLNALSKNTSIENLLLYFRNLGVDDHENIFKSLYKHPSLVDFSLNVLDKNGSNPETYTLAKTYMLMGFEKLSIFSPDITGYDLFHSQGRFGNNSNYLASNNRYEVTDFWNKIYFRNLTLEFDLKDLFENVKIIETKYNLPSEITNLIYDYGRNTLMNV